MLEKQYIAIDLKSFYASVECIERGLDPMTTNLVVADESRTEKTICLAVSPSLKSFGIPGRPRLFEVVQKVKEINNKRLGMTSCGTFTHKSYDYNELCDNCNVSVDYIVAPPQMAHYMKWSSRIYSVYLRYVAPEDIHVYSIDEVFIDATSYIYTEGCSAREFAMKIISDVLSTTGITATAGIGTNMYLCKVAMDIVAKHIPADKNGVRIAELNERSYRDLLWDHRPLTDFWRVGKGYAKKLEDNCLFTMGDIARCSVGRPDEKYNEDLLYKLFGVNAELLIDHAWGWEPCTIADIKSYKPQSNSICSGQVLQEPYAFNKAKIVLREMSDALSFDLIEKGLVTNQVVLTIGFDIENLKNQEIMSSYTGDITSDRYGRKVPKNAHGTNNIGRYTSSSKLITNAVLEIFERTADPNLLIRRMYISVNNVICEKDADIGVSFEQLSLYTNYGEAEHKRELESAFLDKERRTQEAMLAIKKKFGKNSILKGLSYEDGATAIERNGQIGGHKA